MVDRTADPQLPEWPVDIDGNELQAAEIAVSSNQKVPCRWREKTDATVAGRTYFSYSDYYHWCDEFEAQQAEIERLTREIEEATAGRDAIGESHARLVVERGRLRAGLERLWQCNMSIDFVHILARSILDAGRPADEPSQRHCYLCDIGLPKVKADLHYDEARNASFPCTAVKATGTPHAK